MAELAGTPTDQSQTVKRKQFAALLALAAIAGLVVSNAAGPSPVIIVGVIVFYLTTRLLTGPPPADAPAESVDAGADGPAASAVPA